MSRALRAALLAATLLLSGALSTPAEAKVVDRVAAVVNNEVIALSEVYDLGAEFIESRAVGEGPDGPGRREAELEVLDALIQRALIAQEIERLDLSVTRDELERTIDDVARQNGLERDQLRVEVERSGFTWSSYRDEMEENLRQMKFSQIVIRPRVQVTDDEVRDLYNRRIKSLSGAGGKRVVQGILLPWPDPAPLEARAELAMVAQDIVERAAEGERWRSLVSEHPESPYYDSNGDMGTYSPGELVAEIDQAVFAAEVGVVASPVALDGGLLIVRVASEEAGAVPSVDDVRADLEAELADQKMGRETEIWYTQARRRATVDIKLETDAL